MSAPAGLSAAQARQRLETFGPNDIEAAEHRGWGAILRGVATEPMFALLMAAAAVYLAIGDPAEGILLASFAALTVGLVVLQERRSERALDALRELAAPTARVLRDGQVQRIPARELVPGDVVMVGEGDRVPADAVAREAFQLHVDESLLSGEPVPVRKTATDSPTATSDASDAHETMPGGDDTPFLFAGTLVTSGRGVAEVVATGGRSQAGRIGLSLAAISQAPTPLQVRLRTVVAWLGAAAILLSIAVAVGYALVHGDWLQGVLSGIAAAMALLPEEFPMALTVFFAIGAWRLAQVRVLARRPAVIEALGAATVLCVDKTGTLTRNRMRLRRLVTPASDVDLARGAPLPQDATRMLESAMLASRADGVDPMDRAVLAAGEEAHVQHLGSRGEFRLEREYPLTAQLLAVSFAWKTPDGAYEVVTKGSPEAVVSLCRMPAEQATAIAAQVEALARDGLRVLGVAVAAVGAGPLAQDVREHAFTWLGLAAFEDPLRDSVPAAVRQARAASIAVTMITGDHALTALAIARQAGIETQAGARTGAQVEAMSDDELADAVRRVRVFARVLPHQKLRLVQAFRANGEVVAMTGDGVNDAPALKAAHIGIAMGSRGTDVAREAAGLVLLDDDFSHIVEGVRMGRRIQDNLRKVTIYIAAIHVPIAGLALLPLAAGLPPLMLPAHVVLTEMFIDPMCALAFEGAPDERGNMARPPRSPRDALIGWGMLGKGLLQGAAVLAAALAVYALALGQGSVDAARAQGFVALTAGNLGLVWLNASAGNGWRAVFGAGYTALRWVALTATALLLAALLFEPARRLLHFDLPSAGSLAVAAAAGAAAVLLTAFVSAFTTAARAGRVAPVGRR